MLGDQRFANFKSKIEYNFVLKFFAGRSNTLITILSIKGISLEKYLYKRFDQLLYHVQEVNVVMGKITIMLP